MRHRVHAQHFNRDTNHRKAMFKNLLSSLFFHGAIETTQAKAKVIKSLADKIIGKALPRTVPARRLLERFFGSKQVVNQVVDGVAPAMSGRTSGFTRIVPLGRRRGDDASMVKLELVNPPLERVEATPVAAPAPVAPKTEKKVAKKKAVAAEVETKTE